MGSEMCIRDSVITKHYFFSFIIMNAVVLLNMVIVVIVDVMTIEAKQTLLASDNTEENTN